MVDFQRIQKECFWDLSFSVEDIKNIIRFLINDLLQVDFVNDIAFRYKDVVLTPQNYLIDNIENILSNKLTAIVGRDNPKDVFDIYLIWKYYTFRWEDILNSAHQKAGFLDDFEEEFVKILEEISDSLDSGEV